MFREFSKHGSSARNEDDHGFFLSLSPGIDFYPPHILRLTPHPKLCLSDTGHMARILTILNVRLVFCFHLSSFRLFPLVGGGSYSRRRPRITSPITMVFLGTRPGHGSFLSSCFQL